MKVYFGCSIRGGRDNAHLYQNIVDAIKSSGAEVLSELFADTKVTPDRGIGAKKNMSSHDIWKWDLDWVREADVLIMEVTQPSLGVGYEIAKAEEWGKPILALFYEPSDGKLSAMIEGSDMTQTEYYSTPEQAQDIVAKFIKDNS